jgi:hypothetical protein
MKGAFFNFQHISAWVSFLGFLGTALALSFCGVGAAVLLLVRQRRPAMWLVGCAAAGGALYTITLLGFSLASREQIASPGQEKYMCEGDCHLAYSILGMTTARRLGTPPRPAEAHGTFYIVRVRTWFDERTISPRRPKNMPLTRSPRVVEVVDASGRSYPISTEGEEALEAAQGKQPSLSGPLVPGQSSSTDLVFDLPHDVKNPRLLITDSDWITLLLIGNENSFLHAKTTFALGPPDKPGDERGGQGPERPRSSRPNAVHNLRG